MNWRTEREKGYLRTGKILQLLGKDSTALGIYKYGLRNVPPSDLHSDVGKTISGIGDWT